MTSANPLLIETGLPAFSRIRPEHVEPALDAILAEYRQTIEHITHASVPIHFDTIMMAQERLELKLTNMFAPVGHLHAVANTPALREAYTKAIEKLTNFSSEMGQNHDLYEKVKQLADQQDEPLSQAQKAVLDHALKHFELAGVALDEPERDRFRQISRELAQLDSEFSNAVLDATDAWQYAIEDEQELAGLPESERAVLHHYAQEKGLDGYLVTLKQPAAHAIMTYADNRSLREKVYHAYGTRASDQGPDAGKFDNSERIERILRLKHEAAQLLGYHNSAEVSLVTKMADSPATVMSFLQDLVEKAKPVAEQEFENLQTFAREKLGIDALAPWDVAYASEKWRQEHYALDQEQLKPYFAVPKVIDGMFQLVGQLYGIRFAPRSDVDVWHEDVRFYDLLDADGTPLAGLYMDLYARQGKRGGAWMDVCRPRCVDGSNKQLPVAFLNCNFAAPSAGKPALITHDDVETLFHEFGHSLHHMLTEVDLPSVGGIDGVEWDAVEMPSQFMENFCWDKPTLDMFARHVETDEPLPDDLFKRMLATRHFHAGMFLVRQLEFALFDFRLHLEYDPMSSARVMDVLQEVRQQVAVVQPPQWHRFPHAFTHIFAGGYSAGYYSYLWAEVLSADAFDKFARAGVINRDIGKQFRREVLARGATRSALDNFVAFRERQPDSQALLKSYGLAN